MIRPIVKSPALLSMPSVDATPADAAVGQDLLDTLAAHAHECVGLAANMIGVRKRVIEGSRLCTRYRRIKVAYLDASFTPRKKSFSGFDAQIVQHEIDHCNGVVI